jgi:SAM-dependent methyltransferase
LSQLEGRVTAHYRHGGLEAALLAALQAAGKDVEHLTPHDLMGSDEFHIGGAQATQDLAARLGLHEGMHLLDIGSGIGGVARQLAATYGCRVTGIDLSAEFVAVASSLTRRMGLSERVSFHMASANSLDFPPASFDGAVLLHVGMNVPDKAALFARVHAALRPGGFLAVYDIMRTGPGALDFPQPWSSVPETSFVEPPDAYRAALTGAGFTIADERDRGAFAAEFFKAMQARMAQPGPPAIGPGIVMGPAAPQKLANMRAMVGNGTVAPVEMIARK